MLDHRLFQPDFFSKPKILFRPVARKRMAAIRDQWNSLIAGHGQIESITEIVGSSISSENYIVKTPAGKFILKINKRAASPVLLKILDKLMRLDGWGDFFPETYFIRRRAITPIGRREWRLKRFIEGVHPAGRKKDLLSAMSTVGHMTLFLKRHVKDFQGIMERDYFTSPEMKDYARVKKGGGRIIPQMQRHWQLFDACYQQTLREFRVFKGQHVKHAIYVDAHPRNVLITPSGKVFFVDLDSILCGYVTAGLGFGLFKILRNYAALNRHQGTAQKIVGLRKTIIKRWIRDGVIKKSEAQWLPLGARLEVIKRTLLIVSQILETGNSPWRRFLPVHLRALEEIPIIFGESAK